MSVSLMKYEVIMMIVGDKKYMIDKYGEKMNIEIDEDIYYGWF